MIIKAKEKRRLAPGVHLVSVKDISIARERSRTPRDLGLPLEFVDKETGEKYGAIEVLFMDKDSVGVKERFCLGDKHQWILMRLRIALGLPTEGQIDVAQALNRKLWVVIARCIMYENQIMRTDSNGPVWFPKMLPEYFPASEDRPMLKGNPQDNEGKCGYEFTLHQDNKLGLFTPAPNYISPYDLPTEGFGSFQ